MLYVHAPHPSIVDTILQEFQLHEGVPTAHSLYFSGSLSGVERMIEVLGPNAEEITLEASVEDRFEVQGVNRICLNVQTLDDLDAVYRVSRVGNVSVDLPRQKNITETLRRVVDLPIQHVSMSNLEIETINESVETLRAHGFERYEIGAFAKPGYESKQMVGVWTGLPYLGLGPSACSYQDGRRFRNVNDPKVYSEQVAKGILPTEYEEKLPPEAAMREQIAVELRLLRGVPLEKVGIDLDALIEQGLLEKTATHLRLTERGRLFYDTVASEII